MKLDWRPAAWRLLVTAALAVTCSTAASEPSSELVPEGEPYDKIRPLLDRIHLDPWVEAVAFSPDGRFVASGSYDHTVWLWDVESGRESQRLEGHIEAVLAVAFSPDGRMLASGSEDKTVLLWDLNSGRILAKLEGHSSSVRSVAFSRDGRILASGSVDNTLRLWDVASGRELARLEGHVAPVLSIAFAPDGNTLASGSGDNRIRLWDLGSRHLRALLKGHDAAVSSVAFSSDGSTLASGSGDMTVRLWDVATGRERNRLEGHKASVLSIAISPDGQTLASGSDDQTVRLWDLASARERMRLDDHEWSVRSVAFSPDGRTLASGSYDGTVRLWDAVSGRARTSLEGSGTKVRSIAFSPDGKTLAIGAGNTLRLWDLSGGRELARLEGHESEIESVAFSPDGLTLASGSRDQTVRLWEVASGRERARLEGHEGPVLSVAFSFDGLTLASGSLDETVRFWDLTSARESLRLQNSFGPVKSLAFSPDRRTLAIGSCDKTVRLWDLSSGRERARLAGHGFAVWSVAFSPDGKTLASGAADGIWRLWDVARGREQARFESGRVLSIAFSPDGRTLVSGSRDGTVRLWDIAGGRLRTQLKGHGDAVMAVAFSPDGGTLATGSEDHTVRLWVASESERLTAAGPISRSAFPDEKEIFLVGDRGAWASCMALQEKCFRRDDGTLIATADPTGRTTPLSPTGENQPLLASLAERIWGASPQARIFIADPDAVLTLKVRVSNVGRGRAFWLRVVPDPRQPSVGWALEPGEAVPFADPAESPVTLRARIHFLDRPTDPAGFGTTIRLAVAQAYGDPTPLEPVTVKIVPPMLQIQDAGLLRNGGQRVIAVTLKNSAQAIDQLSFRLSVPELTRQPARLLEDHIEPSGTVALSFGIDPDKNLPSGLEANLSAVMGSGEGGLGMPELDWEFRNIPVRSAQPPWGLIAGALALFITLAAGGHYQVTYRNPAVVRLTANPPALRDIELGDMEAARRALKRAARLDPVLRAAKVDPSWLESAIRLEGKPNVEERLALLANRLGLPLEPAAGGGLPYLLLPAEFSLNLPRLRLRGLDGTEAPQDVLNELGRAGEVTMALGATVTQRRQLSALARRRPSMLVAPDGSELTRLMLAEDPSDELARLIARYVPITQISPYQTGAGVHRQSLFFGRGGILALVMGRDPTNYLVVGGRQVGKSSLLKEVQRRLESHPLTDCRYLVLTGANGVAPMLGALGLPASAGIAGLLDEFRTRSRRHTVFLLDEADAFIEGERQSSYKTLQALRALSEEGRAHFMLAGFWSLYRQAALDYQSPLKNFGSVLTLGALEREACRALAMEPMERLGVRWESDALVDRLIEQTGQRANLISIACDEVLYDLGQSERTISSANLDGVLAGNRIRDALLGWADLSPSKDESRLDRIVVYATIDQASFTLADVLTVLESVGFSADPENVKRSLARLELAFVLGRRGNAYSYQVPLQRDLIRADDTRQLLRTEIRTALA